MQKWLIFVKNSEDSLIFTNFGCFGLFRVKIVVSVVHKSSKKLEKANLQCSTPAKMTLIFVLDHHGTCCHRTCCHGTHKKWQQQKQNFGPKSHMCPFSTYLYFWEGSWLQVMILEKVANFGNLEEMVFEKPADCTSKLCNRLPAWLCPKREIKRLFLRFRWEICLTLWFFVPKFPNKSIYGNNWAEKCIKVA